MSILEISKISRPLAVLLDENNLIIERAAREFAIKKGIPVKDAIEKKGDWMLILELNRYADEYLNLELNKRIPDNVKFERINIDGISVEWIKIPNIVENQVIFYLFGGAFLVGTLESRRWIPYLLSKASKIGCLNVGYRLAPENPFPMGLNDSIKAYKWLLSQGCRSKNIIIAGASSGGGMVMSTLLRLRELKIDLPAAGVLLSPWVDLSSKGKSIKKNAIYEPELASILRPAAVAYLQGTNKKDPLASPVYANLESLPPLLIQVGSIEILLDDSVLLADCAKSAGVNVTLEVWKNMNHVFQSFGDELPDSQQAIEHIAEFIRKSLS